MDTITKITPMLQQYLEIKEQHRDAILFYRMGDFYEMFFDDAIHASKILGITLTSRNKKSDEIQVPMCGIPYHAAQSYLAKLIRAGQRVAICEQVEDPAVAKGIVKREVVRIISPGILSDELLLDGKSNNFICSLIFASGLCGLSFLDISTGEFFLGEFPGEELNRDVLDQILRHAPAEILYVRGEDARLADFLGELRLILPELCVTLRDDDDTSLDNSRQLLLDHFHTLSLDGFGCGRFTAGVIGAATLLRYVGETQKTTTEHINKLTPLSTDNILLIDESSRRNLELTETLVGGQRQGSLLSVLDLTCTPMGARLLRGHLLAPLRDAARINARLDGVSCLLNNSGLRRELRQQLASVYDLERLNSRMILGVGNGRDMLAMKTSLSSLPTIRVLLDQCHTTKLIDIRHHFDCLTDIHDLLEAAINPEAPLTVREGHLIRAGYNDDLDQLVLLLTDQKKLILDLESRERQRSGIAKLKVGYNKVFGYFIEIGKTHEAKVPDCYIRKQTLVNAERFITPELKAFEEKILGAEESRLALEYQLFLDIRQRLVDNSPRIQNIARLLAQLDYLASCAEVAFKFNYRRPEVDHGDEIHILEGRHPVIERSLASGKFVPNDIHLDQRNEEILIITGPNMAGKSTVLRQTALIVLMAQMGCYVPAEKAVIGLVDRIFTRVGAMDNLRRGQSTFMVEMSETANILNNATEKSLVILDEIGRGTSTYDGLAIAWAVAEDLVEKNRRGVKTLFATHYHELTELAKVHQRIKNYSIAVREWQGNIIFLHKLVNGGASRSYGIQVAGLAGVPAAVVQRAKEILRDIEMGSFQHVGGHAPLARGRSTRKSPDQLSLFPPPADPIREYIKSVDLDHCTPLEALNRLHTLKTMVER